MMNISLGGTNMCRQAVFFVCIVLIGHSLFEIKNSIVCTNTGESKNKHIILKQMEKKTKMYTDWNHLCAM